MEQNKKNTITEIFKPELPTIEALLLINSSENANIQTLALQELSYLEQHAAKLPAILDCTHNSIILAVKSVIRKNLSLDPSAGLVYIKTRNQNIAPYGQKPQWVKVLEIQDTANGIVSYNRQIGRLLDYTNPKVQKDRDGKVISVSMRLLLPSYPAPRWEDYEFDESDFQRWKTFSHKENCKSYDPEKANGKPAPNPETLNYANALYTSWKNGIDPEFARAKCIKHSCKKLGSNPNESGRIVIKPQAPIVDPNIAFAEAEEDNLHDYAQHEEITTIINIVDKENENNEEFNAGDL